MDHKKEVNELYLSDLQNELNSLNPEKHMKNLIKEINKEEINSYQKNPKKKYSNTEESKGKNQFLEEIEFLRNIYINQFIDESMKRTDMNAKNFIPSHAKDFKEKVGLIIKKADEEYNSYKQKLDSIELKNKELQRNINIVESHKNILFSQLQDAEESISKINKKYNIFNELKPYYDELITEFNIDPNTYKPKKRLLSNDIRRRRKEAENFGDEINKAREKIKEIKEQKRKEDLNNRKLNEQFSSDLKDVEIKNRNIEDEYNYKFNKIKQEIYVSSEFKEENFLLRNTFFTIFNIFYDKLYLERDLNINPKGIPLEREDYTPKTYETNEMVKYIYLMLKNSNEDTTGLLLREIVSYCNMMLRNVQKGPDKVYYEPLTTVKQIEALITSIEKQNDDLKKKIDLSTKINEENQNVINNLLKEINIVEKMNEILHSKMRDYYKKEKKVEKRQSEHLYLFEETEDKFGNKKKKRSTNKIYDFQRLINKNKILEERFNKIRAKFDNNNNKENKNFVKSNLNIKTDFNTGVGELVAHTNRLFFYRSNLNLKPKEVNLYMKAYKRMKKKLKHLKKVEPNLNNYISLENVVFNTVNGHIDNLIGGLKTLGK